MCVGGDTLRLRVQQGDRCREEAFPEPAGPGTEHPVAPPEGEEVKQSVAGVRAVLDDAACPPQAPLALDSLNGGEWGTCDALGGFHHPLEWLPFCNRAAHTILTHSW